MSTGATIPNVRDLTAEANNFLDFWKFPAHLYRLVAIGDGVTAIGEGIAKVPPAAREPAALHAVRDAGASVFCALAELSPPGEWVPLLCRESNGRPLAWSSADRRKFLFGFDVQQAIDDLLSEAYRSAGEATARTDRLRRWYYRMRPLIPRALQLALRKRYAKTQELAQFPAWPVEDSLMFLMRTLAWCVARAGGDDVVPHIAFWPEGARCCVVLTHDIEQSVGVKNIGSVVAIEKKYGFRSSWNFVPERYPFERSLLTQLQNEGFEIGVHGLTHDGRLFESRKIFDQRAPKINAYGKDWGAVGFRSPATHRIYSWIAEGALQFQYDSSYPDTDPYQPMPGGCCNLFPWFLGEKVEIPITLPQDHVLFETLQDESATRWHAKFDYIERQGGMACLIVHPDYLTSPRRLQIYAQFLEFLSQRKDVWFALPREVADWWVIRKRYRLHIGDDGRPQLEGELGAGDRLHIQHLAPTFATPFENCSQLTSPSKGIRD